MVGFLRKKKADKATLSFDTALDRKGKIDGASLLDDNGDPTSGSLFDARSDPRNPTTRRSSNQENAGWDTNAAASSHTYPVPAAMHTGFGSASAGYPRQYGAHQPQQPQQQYPVRYGAHEHQQSYGAPQNAYGAPLQHQPQYPMQYGNYPPPMQPEAPKKSSFFRIPGIGKKN